jgi:glycosyltransferase involved in cell wall biosynthesis
VATPSAGRPQGPSGRGRALWVTEEPPDRNRGGGNIRQAHLLSALAARIPTSLLLAGHLEDDQTRAVVAAVTEVAVEKVGATSRWRRRGRDAVMALGAGPAEVYVNRPTRRVLRPVLARLAADADVVVVSHQALAPLVPRRHDGFWVAQLHHVAAEKARQELGTVQGRRQRWVLEREMSQARGVEQRLVDSYDAVCVVCDEDAALLGVPSGRQIVAANGVDLARYRCSPVPAGPRVLLPGSLDYLPNVDGARWFCEEVWGRVRAAVPDAVLDLVGRAPVAEVTALGGLDGVSVHRDVESMVPWLDAARVVIVPLRVGTGTRLKALEAMAAGRPVVGTSVGLAGLGLRDGVDALVADQPDVMASAVARVLLDSDAAGALGASGRRHVERGFDWADIGSSFAEQVCRMARLPGSDA